MFDPELRELLNAIFLQKLYLTLHLPYPEILSEILQVTNKTLSRPGIDYPASTTFLSINWKHKIENAFSKNIATTSFNQR